MLLVPKSMPSSVPRRISGCCLPLLCRNALNIRAQRVEGFFKVFVTAVDPLHALYDGFAARRQPGNDQGCAPTEVRSLYHGPVEPGNSGDHTGAAILVNDCAHPAKFRNVLGAVLVDGFLDDR